MKHTKKEREYRRIKNSKHHIIPLSRGGKSNLENIANITQIKHRAYHTLFDNKVPTEIVSELVNHYWNGNWNYVKESYNENNTI